MSSTKIKIIKDIIYIGAAVSFLLFFYIVNIIFEGKINPAFLGLLFLGCGLFTIFIHEIGHAFVYKLQKNSLRVFSFCGITLVNHDNKHKVYYINNITRGSSFVAPKLTYAIDSNMALSRFQRTHLMALTAGPLFPVIILVPIAIVSILQQEIYLKTSGIVMLISSLVQFIVAFFKQGDNAGDFVLLKKYKNEFSFICMLLSDLLYIRESLNIEEAVFLCKKAEKSIFQKDDSAIYSLLNEETSIILNRVIMNNLLYKVPISQMWKKFIDYYEEKFVELSKTSRSEKERVLLIHLLYYWKIIDNNVYKKYIHIGISIFSGELEEYYHKQICCFCLNEDYQKYLEKISNIKNTLLWEYYSAIGIKYYSEELLLLKLFFTSI